MGERRTVRLRILTILVTAAPLLPGAQGVGDLCGSLGAILLIDRIGNWIGGVTISDAAALALFGAALLVFSRLLRKRLRGS